MQLFYQLLVFRFLSGSDLFHRVALLSRTSRKMISNQLLLNQKRVLTLVTAIGIELVLPARDSFVYAMSFVTALEIKLE